MTTSSIRSKIKLDAKHSIELLKQNIKLGAHHAIRLPASLYYMTEADIQRAEETILNLQQHWYLGEIKDVNMRVEAHI